MGDTGFEEGANVSRNRDIVAGGGVKTDVFFSSSMFPKDEDLLEVINAWHRLSSTTRAQVLALVSIATSDR